MKFFSTLLCTFIFSMVQAQTSHKIPTWFKTHIEKMVGTWEADNSKYKGENEAWDAYGMEWTYGIGNMSLNGFLYGIKDGKKSGNFWEFKTFWNPKDGKVYAQQFGGDGTFGTGEMLEDKTTQTFYNPDGSSNVVGHEAWFDENGNHHTKSFNVTEEGEWEDRRYYVWEKAG